MGFGGGTNHDQVVLEDGVWKFWSVVIDDMILRHPMMKADGRRRVVILFWLYARKVAAAEPNNYLLEIPLTKLGGARRGLRGGTGDVIDWPGILPMWFHATRQRTRSGSDDRRIRVPRGAVPRDQHEERRLPAAAPS